MVYVDDMAAPYRGMKMCHMVADTEAELHAMADKIGVARKWYQYPKKSAHPHYDICLTKRAIAVSLGAQEIRWRDAPAITKRCREHSKALQRTPERVQLTANNCTNSENLCYNKSTERNDPPEPRKGTSC